MSPVEFWWLVEAKMPEQQISSPETMKELRDMVKSAKAKERAANREAV